MDGLEMIRKIRLLPVKAYFIIFSAYDRFSFDQEAVKLGAVDYLLKPCSFSELYDIVERILISSESDKSPLDRAKDLAAFIAERKGESEQQIHQLKFFLKECKMAAGRWYSVICWNPNMDPPQFHLPALRLSLIHISARGFPLRWWLTGSQESPLKAGDSGCLLYTSGPCLSQPPPGRGRGYL